VIDVRADHYHLVFEDRIGADDLAQHVFGAAGGLIFAPAPVTAERELLTVGTVIAARYQPRRFEGGLRMSEGQLVALVARDAPATGVGGEVLDVVVDLLRA
jgi:hypothetical protein